MAYELDTSAATYRKIELNKTNNENTTGYQQQVENYFQESKERSEK